MSTRVRGEKPKKKKKERKRGCGGPPSGVRLSIFVCPIDLFFRCIHVQLSNASGDLSGGSIRRILPGDPSATRCTGYGLGEQEAVGDWAVLGETGPGFS